MVGRRQGATLDIEIDKNMERGRRISVGDRNQRGRRDLGAFSSLSSVIFALVPDLFSPLDPLSQDLGRYLKAPGYVDKAGDVYWLGTDQQGRDILSRIIWGSRISLIVGIAAVIVSGLIGITVGIFAGYFGGWVDTVISRIIDTALAVPFILLAISLVAILGPSLQNIVLVIALRPGSFPDGCARGGSSIRKRVCTGGGPLRHDTDPVHLPLPERGFHDHRHRHPVPGPDDHHRIRTLLPGAGRAASHADVGRNARRRQELPRHGLVDSALPGPHPHAHGLSVNLLGTGCATCSTRE